MKRIFLIEEEVLTAGGSLWRDVAMGEVAFIWRGGQVSR